MSDLKDENKKEHWYSYTPKQKEEIKKSWEQLKHSGRELGDAMDKTGKASDSLFGILFKLIIVIALLILIGLVFFL